VQVLHRVTVLPRAAAPTAPGASPPSPPPAAAAVAEELDTPGEP
jgi:hypothetical protein